MTAKVFDALISFAPHHCCLVWTHAHQTVNQEKLRQQPDAAYQSDGWISSIETEISIYLKNS